MAQLKAGFPPATNDSAAVSTPACRLTAASEKISSLYAAYVVFVLIVCYTFSFADRQILSLLVGPIKQDLGLSDTKIGLLQGLAFAVFYAALGFPLGRLSDRGSRRNLIAIGVFLWSIMTSLCSLAKSFTSLFLTRIGVGVGEAALSPAAVPLISDYFPEERLGTALSFYTMGAAIGSGVALAAGGVVVDSVARLRAISIPFLGVVTPWRLTFLFVGLPGLLLVPLVRTIQEPLRRNLLRRGNGSPSHLSVAEVFLELRRRWRSMAGLSAGMVFQSVCGVAFFAWAPTFFVRAHNWTAGEAGRLLGVATLIFCSSGMYAGGLLADHWHRKQMWEGPLRVGVLSAVGMAVSLIGAVAAPGAGVAMGCAAVALFFIGLPSGCVFAAIQMIFPNQVRGQISALFFMALNLGGMVFGSLLPGLFADHLFRNERMIGSAVALTTVISCVSMVVIFPITYQHYRRDYLTANPGRV